MAKRGGASDINGFISFASNPKKTNSKTKTTVKRQSTLNDDGNLETERKKKQKESIKSNKEGALEKYGDKIKIRDEKFDHKTEQKKNEKVKAKEKEKEKIVKSREKKTVSTKPNSEITRIKDKDKNTADNKVHKSKTSSNKRTDEGLYKTKTEKNTKVLSTPKKSNERSGTATLSRSNKTSKALPIVDRKDDDKYNEKLKTSGAYDPRKKERELEKKAKESLEKIYKLNSLIKSKNSKTTNDKMKAKKQKNDKDKSKKEHSTPTRGHERIESIEGKSNTNVIYKNTNENETLIKSPVLSPNHSNQTDVDTKAAGDSFLGESSIKVEEKSEDEYEDDFESYESDFEECTESGVSEDETFSITTEDDDETDSDCGSNRQEKPTIEEERKLDSGNYDLATLKQRRQINEIKDAMLKENSLYNLGESRNEKMVTDEMPLKTSNDNFFINFTSARQRQKKEKVKAAIQNRGDKLLEMIRLDMMSFSILDLPAVPYEVYIQCYGKSNNVQMHTQTNEENLSEEVQTEDIKVCSKWTQHPVAFYTTTSESQDLLQCFAKERLGVGGDDIDTENEGYIYNNPINSLRLHNFFSAAAEVMLVLLEEEEESKRMKCKSVLSHKKNLGFSDGHISILVNNVEFLEKRKIKLVQFSLTAQNQIVAVHESSKTTAVLKQESHSLMEESLGRCMISVWSIHEPSMPQKILASPDEVSTVIFYENFVIAGLKEGSVCLWDLREKSIWHKRTGVQDAEWTLHSPTFITAKVLSESAHGSTVVSIQCLNNKTEKKTEFTSVTQVATLEEEGILIIWTVVNLSKFLHKDCSVHSNIPGLAPWGRVRLVSSASIDVTTCFARSFDTKLQFRVMAVNNNHIYIGTNVGLVAHCIQPSGKTQPLIYRTKLEDTTYINCIEPSPDGNPMFLVGTNGGRVRLYLNRFEFPLVDVAGTAANPGPAIISLQWSLHRAGVFFILDENSCLHIWDLCKSDIFPLFSVPMNDALVSTIQISPHKETQFLAIGTDKGVVEIHKLSSELGKQSTEIQKKEKEIFSHYISIL